MMNNYILAGSIVTLIHIRTVDLGMHIHYYDSNISDDAVMRKFSEK